MSLSEEDIKRIANEVYELQKRDKQFTVKNQYIAKNGSSWAKKLMLGAIKIKQIMVLDIRLCTIKFMEQSDSSLVVVVLKV